MNLATDFIPNPQESEISLRPNVWFIEKGEIFSTVVSRIANEFQKFFNCPATLNIMWTREMDLTLKPKFEGKNVFSDGLCMVAGITMACKPQKKKKPKREGGSRSRISKANPVGLQSEDHGNQSAEPLVDPLRNDSKWQAKNRYRDEIAKCILPILREDSISTAQGSIHTATDWVKSHKNFTNGTNLGCCAETIPLLSILPGTDHSSKTRELWTCAFDVARFPDSDGVNVSSLPEPDYRFYILVMYYLAFKEPCNSCRKVFKDSKSRFQTLKAEQQPNGSLVLGASSREVLRHKHRFGHSVEQLVADPVLSEERSPSVP
ncbi:hypothetical protein FS837_002624 [Tulasnella sp. UAMH 9824]|nr:hypothetical protein FS837_002624 [Tulasnella sp. UAMH 9824]